MKQSLSRNEESMQKDINLADTLEVFVSFAVPLKMGM